MTTNLPTHSVQLNKPVGLQGMIVWEVLAQIIDDGQVRWWNPIMGFIDPATIEKTTELAAVPPAAAALWAESEQLIPSTSVSRSDMVARAQALYVVRDSLGELEGQARLIASLFGGAWNEVYVEIRGR